MDRHRFRRPRAIQLALDYQRLQHADVRILADTSIAIPMLTELLKARLKNGGAYAGRVKTRGAEIAKQSEAKRARWAKEAREDWDASPIMLRGSHSEVWMHQGRGLGAYRQHPRGVNAQLWDFDKPYRTPDLAPALRRSSAFRSAWRLAHRDKKRLVVDIQPTAT